MDRRRSQRHAVLQSHLITVDLDFQAGALLLTLNESGMSVQLVIDPPKQKTTTFRFELPEAAGEIKGVGRIAWTDDLGRMGIHFETLDEISYFHLSEWLSSYALSPNEPPVALPSRPAPPAPPRARDEVSVLRRELAAAHLSGDEALAFIVERVSSVTGATGVALALGDGSQVVCRASSGNAPPVGALVDPESGLTGECLRTGSRVCCDDTETETRVDPMVCRQLDLRSMVIVPILMQQRPVGVLEAFSSQPHAFNGGDELLLRSAADLVAELAAMFAEPAPPETTMAPVEPEPQAEPESALWMDSILATLTNLEDAPAPAASVEQQAEQPQETLSYMSRFIRRARVGKRPRSARQSSAR